MALKFAVNNSLSAITSLPTAIPTGSMTLLQTQTASSSATIEFTSNIDSTYDSYVFKLINIHPQTDTEHISFNGSIDGGSNYNVTKTSTFFTAYNLESDVEAALGYTTSRDLAQSTAVQKLIDIDSANDMAASGYLHLFNPSSTTFVKHFIARFSGSTNEVCKDTFIAGYFNDTNDINAIQFSMTSGNIDSGVIKLYGIS